MSARDGSRDSAGHNTASHNTAGRTTSGSTVSDTAVRRSVAGRRQQTWASRWNGGRPEGKAASGAGTGWEVVSYLLAGLLVYGGIGWVVAHFTHIELFFPIGMLFGVALSLWWVVYKYGRQ